MMKLLIASLFLVCGFAFAETETPPPSTSQVQSADLSAQPETDTPRKSSTQNRADKTWFFTFEPMGLGPSGVFGQGLNLGLFLGDRSLIQLELNGGHNSLHDDFLFSWGDKTVQDGFSAGVYYKRFVGNSFYAKSGLDYRTIDFKHTDDNYDWFTGTNDADTTREFSGESGAVSLAIGNQWQMTNFTIGCDWAGIELPVASRVYNVSYSDNASATDRRKNRDDFRHYVTSPSYTILRFYLGASF